MSRTYFVDISTSFSLWQEESYIAVHIKGYCAVRLLTLDEFTHG